MCHTYNTVGLKLTFPFEGANIVVCCGSKKFSGYFFYILLRKTQQVQFTPINSGARGQNRVKKIH